jgi:Zn-dependent protease
LTDFTLQQLGLRLCALILLIGVYGVAVAGAACALGDPGPRHDGRLRLSPLAHVDLLGLLSGVLFSVGWIKPIAVDPQKLRVGRVGLVFVVVAGAVSVLAVALVLQWVRPVVLPLLGDASSTFVFGLVDAIGQAAVWFALLNLLPLPPFMGALMLTALVPQAGELLRRYHLYAALLGTAVAATGLITGALAPLHRMVASLVLAG